MKTTLSTRVDDDARIGFERVAEECGMSVSELLRSLVENCAGTSNTPHANLTHQLKSAIGISLKTLYLTKYLAEAIDPKAAKLIMDNADRALSTMNEVAPRQNEGN